MENLFRDDTRKTKKRKKTPKATLSFAVDDEEEAESVGDVNGELSANGEDGTPAPKRSRLKKNPNVDTSFLPDREREEAERKERERLRVEWLTKQEAIKKEDIEVVYSYWDGSGHRKSVMVSDFTELWTQALILTFEIYSARKAMILVPSSKNVERSSLSSVALASTILCTSR